MFVVQAGPMSPAEMYMHARLASTLRTVYRHVASYWSYVPTYAAPWGFLICADRPIDTRPDPAGIDEALERGMTGGLRMFDGLTLLGMYQLPLHVRKAIAEETQVYTLKTPPKFFGKGIATEPAPTP